MSRVIQNTRQKCPLIKVKEKEGRCQPRLDVALLYNEDKVSYNKSCKNYRSCKNYIKYDRELYKSSCKRVSSNSFHSFCCNTAKICKPKYKGDDYNQSCCNKPQSLK